MTLDIARITSLPSELDYRLFIDALLGAQAMFYHDFGHGATYIVCENGRAASALKNGLMGFSARETRLERYMRRPRMFVVFDPTGKVVLEDAYSLFGSGEAFALLSLVPCDKDHVRRICSRVERQLSKREVRQTISRFDAVSAFSSGSTQKENFDEFDEKNVLLSLMYNFNEAMAANGVAYMASIVIDDVPGNAGVIGYIKSRLYVFAEESLPPGDIAGVFSALKSRDALPLSYNRASRLLFFSKRITKADVVRTSKGDGSGDIVFGEYLEDSLKPTGEPVSVEHTVFNLGALITGLPGAGKTMAAMLLVKQLRQFCNGMMIIDPTGEWSEFADDNGMLSIRLYESKTRVNFFKCDAKINVEKFYENLAMLIASSSNCGPYKHPMEKCLVSAFSRVYSGGGCPNPIDVYKAIEASVAERHAVRFGKTLRYTKHGENIMAALENLRLMLAREEFSCTEGLDFTAAIRRGIVFDLSRVSNNTKPFFYALILNQAYSIADSFDNNGDAELRMVIGLEEAQLVFSGEVENAAMLDLKQRVQDFRKRGICLMLITHNVTDISASIRRLCQIKLYFRQSSDIAAIAARDLTLGVDKEQDVVNRLVGLEQKVCALSYVSTENGLRSPAGSLFVRITSH